MMIDDLKTICKMQRDLDAAELKDKGITEYPKEKVRIALFVEVGEMLNEHQSLFKYWKAHPKDDRDAALEEYVDCLHFATSLHNYDGNHYTYDYDIYTIYETESKPKRILDCAKMLLVSDDPLPAIFTLGNLMGFTWNEVFEAYKKKNAVNFERIKNNY